MSLDGCPPQAVASAVGVRQVPGSTVTGNLVEYLRARTLLLVIDNCEHVVTDAANNNVDNVTFREADVFDLLSSYASARKTFDTVVLDPPAFAKSRKQVENSGRKQAIDVESNR